MKVAGVQRSSTVAWGASLEHSSLLAAGTVAGAISDSFDSSAHLDRTSQMATDYAEIAISKACRLRRDV